MLTVQLLGTPVIGLDGTNLAITRRKSRALLYFLAAHDKPVPRNRLLALFWSDAERAAAQQTLRSTLYALRKALGAELQVEDEQIGVAPDAWVDTREFERLARAGNNVEMLARATVMYSGDFLEGFALPDVPEFDDWVAIERERYRRTMVRALQSLSRAHESAGEYRLALEALDRALAFDPLQEDVQRAALRLHYYAGDRTGAIRRFEQFQQLLVDEMGVPPMAETRALYDAIVTDRMPAPAAAGPPAAARVQPQAPASAADRLPFIGRGIEMETVRGLLAARRVVLIEGEAGIGKTRLLEEVAAEVPQALIGRARELEGVLPYQPVAEALRALVQRSGWSVLRERLNLEPVWLDEVAHLLPELLATQRWANVVPAPVTLNDETRLWEGLYQFMAALARERPLLFALDDAHWADASSLGFFGYLARRATAAGIPLALILAARPAQPRTPLAAARQALLRDGLADLVQPRRLSADEMRALAERLSPSDATALAEWLGRVSEGNPYVINELVREARAASVLQADGALNASALAAMPVPRGVHELIAARLERLSGDARRVLDAAVAAGREFDFAVVSRAAGLSEEAILEALDELRGAGLVRETEAEASNLPAYVFDHSLTMEVAYRQGGEARHRLMHRRVAEALEHVNRARLDPVSGLIAWHYAEGLAPERAAPLAYRAGQLAARLPAWSEAAAFFEQAARGASDERSRHRANLALGEAREQQGMLGAAAEAYREALAYAPNKESADQARLRLSSALMMLGRYAESLELAAEVAAKGDPASRPHAEFAMGAALSVEGADLEGAAAHLRTAAELAANNPSFMARVQFEMGSVEAQRGDLAHAVELYRAALDAAVRADAAGDDSSIWRILAHNNLGYHLHLLADPRARGHVEEGLRLARERGQMTLQTFLLSTLGEIELAEGNMERAEAYFREGLALAEQFAVPERQAGLNANLGRAAAARGQSALAIHYLSGALARAEALGAQHLAAQIHLWLAPLLPPAEARDHARAARRIADAGKRQRLLEQADALLASLSE